MVSDIPAGDGNTDNLSYSVGSWLTLVLAPLIFLIIKMAIRIHLRIHCLGEGLAPGSVDQLLNEDDHKDSPPYPLSRRGIGSWLSNVLTPLIFLIIKMIIKIHLRIHCLREG